MLAKWLDVLAKCSLFYGINSTELETLLDCFKPKIVSYKKNEYITIAGEPFKGIGILLCGEAAVTKESAAGSRVIMTLLSPGELFGEMAAFSDNNEWPATVAAQENCSIMFLESEKIVGYCEKRCECHRLLIKNMLSIISEKALLLKRKVEYCAIKSVRGKISTYLFEQHKKAGRTMLMLPLKRNELADFLNVSRPSLSREMCRMRDEGIIDFHRESIQINDLDALKSKGL